MADEMPKTMSVPEAGKKYYNLSINASYAAAKRGEIPYVKVGKLKRVPVAAMERRLENVESLQAAANNDAAPTITATGTETSRRRRKPVAAAPSI